MKEKKNINILELLNMVGVEGRTFWSPLCGECTLELGAEILALKSTSGHYYFLNKNGGIYTETDGDCLVFPSQAQRSWENYVLDKVLDCQEGKRVIYSEGRGSWKFGVFIGANYDGDSNEISSLRVRYAITGENEAYKNYERIEYMANLDDVLTYCSKGGAFDSCKLFETAKKFSFISLKGK